MGNKTHYFSSNRQTAPISDVHYAHPSSTLVPSSCYSCQTAQTNQSEVRMIMSRWRNNNRILFNHGLFCRTSRNWRCRWYVIFLSTIRLKWEKIVCSVKLQTRADRLLYPHPIRFPYIPLHRKKWMFRRLPRFRLLRIPSRHPSVQVMPKIRIVFSKKTD